MFMWIIHIALQISCMLNDKYSNKLRNPIVKSEILVVYFDQRSKLLFGDFGSTFVVNHRRGNSP